MHTLRSLAIMVLTFTLSIAINFAVFSQDSTESIYTDGKVVSVNGSHLKILEIDNNSNKEVESQYEVTETTRLKRIDGLESLKANELVSVLYKIKDNKRIAIMVSKIVE